MELSFQQSFLEEVKIAVSKVFHLKKQYFYIQKNKMLKSLLFLCIFQSIFASQTPRFSEESKLTVVTTSCGRMDLLKRTYASLFRHNHYPLRELRIIDDCSTPEEQIRACVPITAKQMKYVTVIVNKKHLGQFKSIDRIYQDIKTKFVLHLEDDFQALPNNNILAQSIELLEWAEQSEEKISQIVFGRQLNYHFYRSELHITPSHVGYFVKKSFPDRGNDFSFQPHMSNYDLIYQKMLSSSIMNTIGPRCHECLQNEHLEKIRCVGCFQPQLGEYLVQNGWYNVLLDDDRDNGGWAHIGRFGEHVSMTKIQEFQYYRTGVFCVLVVQVIRLIKEMLFNPVVPEKADNKSEEQTQITS